MNYYSFHLGDYLSHTGHLTDAEDLAYRRMLDVYYQHEKPFTDTDRLARRVRMPKEVVTTILDEFFHEEDDGWHNHRADREIEKMKQSVESASRAGRASAEARGNKKAQAADSNARATTVEQACNDRSTTVEQTFNAKIGHEGVSTLQTEPVGMDGEQVNDCIPNNDAISPSFPPKSNARATTVEQACNDRLTTVQHPLNDRATTVEQACNDRSTTHSPIPNIKVKDKTLIPPPPSPGDGEEGAPPEAAGVRGGKTGSIYPQAFLDAVATYPRRDIPIDKRAAFRAWQARIKGGHRAEEIHAGIERYHRFVSASGNLGTQYVKTLPTFLGPSDPPWFTMPWQVPSTVGIRRGTDGGYEGVDYSQGATTDIAQVEWMREGQS
ncbi:MAG: YdaU family protein [Magnetococcales bacterium]|nr:YdaU family protein [Magnetococcales bacterium]